MQTRRNRLHGGTKRSSVFKKKSVTYRLPVLSKFSAKPSKKVAKLMRLNLNTILEKPSFMNEHDTEYANNVIEKFKNFLERVQRADARLYAAGAAADQESLSNMDMIKSLIAEKLVAAFGNKERAAPVAKATENAFNDDLASLLGRVRI
uniref:Uncharacterized protein n=1 Tax=viral metagenome TaxID=1070528 RepID=A0A6C0IA45_9ZZZZ